MHSQSILTFDLFGKRHQADSLADASAQFNAARDKSGRGSSTMPLPAIEQDGAVVGHFSYNGKIWERPSKEWRPGFEPLFTPYAA